MHDDVDGLEDVLGKPGRLFVDGSNPRAIHVDNINHFRLVGKPNFQYAARDGFATMGDPANWISSGGSGEARTLSPSHRTPI